MNGLILSFAGQKRKQLTKPLGGDLKLQAKNYKIIVKEEIQLIKYKGIVSNYKEFFQQNMKELIEMKLSFNTIYITLQYDRLDQMIQKLEFLIQYLEFYSHNICLIITGFENSTDLETDYQTFCEELGVPFKIKNLYVHSYEGQEKITFLPQFESTYSFFYSTLCQNDKIELNVIEMKLQKQIDQELWDRLNKLLYKSQSNLEQNQVKQDESKKDTNILKNQTKQLQIKAAVIHQNQSSQKLLGNQYQKNSQNNLAISRNLKIPRNYQSVNTFKLFKAL